MDPRLAALLSVGLVSLIPFFVVVFLPRSALRLQRGVPYVVAFAAGALLGGAFIHLIPEAFATGPRAHVPLLMLVGFFGFFVLEVFLEVRSPHVPGAMRPVAVLNLVGDGIHNCVDGMVIAASYLTEPSLGIATTLAVILHEVPQELGDYGVLVFGGLSVGRALRFNLLSASIAAMGAVAVLLVGAWTVRLTTALLPVAAGNFIYIAAADLIPELRRERDRSVLARRLIVVVSGVLVMWLPLVLPAR
jgi:zinc and cadmium transporter